MYNHCKHKPLFTGPLIGILLVMDSPLQVLWTMDVVSRNIFPSGEIRRLTM